MTTILIKKKDTAGAPAPGDLTNSSGGSEIAVNTATKRLYTKDSGGTVVELGTNPSALTTNLLFSPDDTYDIGASGASRPRDLFLSRNLTVGGTLVVTGGINFNGNVTVGDSSADTLTINSTITSNLIFTDNTYDIGAAGATRPRSGYFGTKLMIGTAQNNTQLGITGATSTYTTGLVFVSDTSSSTTGPETGIYMSAVGPSSGYYSNAIEFDIGGGGGRARLYTTRSNSAGGTFYIDTEDSSSSYYNRYYVDAGGGHYWKNVGVTTGATAMTLNSNGLGVNVSPTARLEVYTANSGQTAFSATTTVTSGGTKAAVITVGSNNSSYSGGYGLQVFDKTSNAGGAQVGIGVYIAAPYDGSNATGQTYALTKYGLYVDTIYGYYGADANATWGIYVPGGNQNYLKGNTTIGPVPGLTSAKLTIVSNEAKTSAATCFAIGTSTSGANDFQFFISRSAAGSNSYYAMSSVEQGTAYRGVWIQPNGGATLVGNGNTYSEAEILNVLSQSSTNSKIDIWAQGSGQAGINLRAGGSGNNRATRLDYYNHQTSTSVPRWTLINDYDQNGTNDFRIYNANTGASAITILTGNSNVGLGNNSPSYKLDVTGQIRATNTIITDGGFTAPQNFSSYQNFPVGYRGLNTTGSVSVPNTNTWTTVFTLADAGATTGSDYAADSDSVTGFISIWRDFSNAYLVAQFAFSTKNIFGFNNIIQLSGYGYVSSFQVVGGNQIQVRQSGANNATMNISITAMR